MTRSPIAPASLAYALLRPWLFRCDAEHAHEFALRWLSRLPRIPGALACVRALHAVQAPSLVRHVFGLEFANPLGVAPGLDKNAIAVEALFALGFGHVEVGTVTPRPQPGNDRPRLFRFPAQGALVNRLGFNNEGVEAMARRLAALPPRAPGRVLGINIGKNKDTPNAEAAADYALAARALHAYADYLTVNVSSPNTPGLRDLQSRATLAELLRATLPEAKGKPVLVKLAPDLEDSTLCELLDAAGEFGAAGVILTNTTLARTGITTAEAGGMSGAPLFPLALAKVGLAARHLRGRLPIIGVGGVHSTGTAQQMLAAGAALVQLYTGFVYGGPALPARILRGLRRSAQVRVS